ncbi:MAG: hypothetical protein CSA26_07760 [Desulfobacterales bacterium]|nr:MAG: hypothetical protein CSA26_07760 [Desulfobacterales bacterium]
MTMIDRNTIDSLLAYALNISATRAVCLAPEQVAVEDRLALLCREPKCPYWGLAMSCPPHVGGPPLFRKKLAASSHVIVIQIDVPASALFGDDRHHMFRFLHEITATIEAEAKRLGFHGAQAFAGSSCKQSFCSDHNQCRVLSGQGACRHPEHARQSMSGFGININKLITAAGWSDKLFSSDQSSGTQEQQSWMAGLILLARENAV